MLVVTFDRIEPNRATAVLGHLLAPYAVDTAGVPRRPPIVRHDK